MPSPIRQFLVRTRFRYLLAMLTLLTLLVPGLAGRADTEVGFRVIFTALLLSGVYAVAGSRRDLLIVTALATLGILTEWFGLITESKWQQVTNDVLSILLVSFLAWRILEEVYHDKDVTVDTLMGSICAYLLIGWIFAIMFSMTETLNPGALSGLAPTTKEVSYDNFASFLYYSFVTLTTLGYGDITPVAPYSRTIAFVESTIGQLFPAMLIARFVGIHISQSIAARTSA